MKSKRSTAFLIILLLLAIALGAGVFYLAKDLDYSFLIPDETPPEAAETEPVFTPEPTPAPETPVPDTFVISMIGDCTLCSTQYNNDFEDVLAKHDLNWPFSGTKIFFENDEFTLANLECSFSDSSLTSSSLFYFCAPASHADILKNGSIDCVTLGNNHTNDFGEQGLLDTQSILDAKSIEWVGQGDAKVFQTPNGLKVGVYCPGWTGLSEANIRDGIAALQSAGAQICIFAPHWGNEGSYTVSDNQIAFAHIAIDAGAQIVCGTHPHVLQHVEEYNGGYIFYSLGNYCFGGNTAPRDRDTAIAQVTVKTLPDGTASVQEYTLIPCCLSSTPGVNDYRPVPYGEDTEDYARSMSKLDGSFSGPDLTVDYSEIRQ